MKKLIRIRKIGYKILIDGTLLEKILKENKKTTCFLNIHKWSPGWWSGKKHFDFFCRKCNKIKTVIDKDDKML